MYSWNPLKRQKHTVWSAITNFSVIECEFSGKLVLHFIE